MSEDYEVQFRELAWDDEIENEGSPFSIVTAGDYDFAVTSFERSRYNGSEKVPPCNLAVLTLEVTSPAAKGTVKVNLFLYSKYEWKLCQFFAAIGHRKHGEPLRMNWARVTGATGRCEIGVRKWTGNDGKEHEGNEVLKFLDRTEEPMAPAGQTAGYTPGRF